MNIPEELIPVIDWWQKDGKKTVAILACAGLVALGVYLWIAREKRLDVEASSFAYGAGMTVEQLKTAAAEYADRDVAGVIKLRLAKAYAEAGDFTAALDVYTALAAEKSVPVAFAFAPEFGIASCQESLGNWSEARKVYDSIVAEAKADMPVVFDAKLGSARCLAFSGDRDGAVKGLEALKAACVADTAAVETIDETIDAVKRWQKRAAPAPAPAPAVAPVAAQPVKADVKAADLTLPSAAPKAPAAKEKVPAPVKPAPAPAKAK